MSNFSGLYFNIGKAARAQEILPGLTTLFSFKIPDSSKVEFRFMQDYIGITSGVGVKAFQQGTFQGNGYNPVVNFSGVIGSTLFTLGTDIAFDVSRRTFDEVSVGLSLNSDLVVTSLTLDDKFDTVRASCYHELNPLSRTAVAAELMHSFSGIGETAVTVGAQHALFPFTLMKARVNSHGIVGGLIRLEFWEKLFLAVTGEADMAAANKISRLGLSMAFRA